MNRRSLLVGALAGLCPCGAAHAQWPAPAGAPANDGRLMRIDPRLPGCVTSRDDAQRALSQLRTESFLADDDLEASSADAQSNCEALLDVFGLVAYYDDAGAPNAFATPGLVLGYPSGDGSVLIGKTLVNQWREGHRLGPGARLLYAHEYAHLRQFKMGVALAAPAVELHADFLAGWVLACWDRRVGRDADLGAAMRPFSARSRLYNDPAGHGTPQQRQAAARQGYALGQRRARLQQAFDDGLAWVGA